MGEEITKGSEHATDIDIEGEAKPPPNSEAVQMAETKPTAIEQGPPASSQGQHNSQPNTSNNNKRGATFLGDLPIDVFFEASKLPLDVAIYNSARATGGPEKIRKYLQSVLVIGGSAAIPGMTHALESRYVYTMLFVPRAS